MCSFCLCPLDRRLSSVHVSANELPDRSLASLFSTDDCRRDWVLDNGPFTTQRPQLRVSSPNDKEGTHDMRPHSHQANFAWLSP
ncbi:MAG: hypothetical protein QOF73_2187, partial [Thermomicrobiales bacterium]|nr:hypothetical protein [Thermomicrobiales bacterium]